MQADNEHTLLAAYVADRSEAAFGRLVAVYIDLVFGCAMRRTADAQLAEEVSQNVFTILARKAHKLQAGSGLAGWLHKTTLYESSKALRGESRRQRKMKALAEHTLSNHENADHQADEILPLVDEAIAELSDDDRNMILLHYFEGRSFREISQSTGSSEAASQKRTSRALGKLEKILRRRGVVAAGSALAVTLAAESAKAAPAGIVSSVSGTAIAAAASISTATLITNAIQTMTYAKTKVAILVTAAAAVPIGVQINSNGELKQRVREYEAREIEFVERGERLATLEKKFAALPAEYSQMADTDTALQSEVASAEQKLSALSSKPQPGSKKTAAVAGEGGGEALAAGALDSVFEMMDDPAMRNILKEQMQAQFIATYGHFLDYLDLDDEKTAAVTEALLDRQTALTGQGVRMIKEGGLSAGADLVGDGSEMVAVMEEFNEKLKALLGEEKFAELERFDSSTMERQELAAFRETLKEHGVNLPLETEQKLMAVMYEERRNPASAEAVLAAGLGAGEGVVENERALQARIRTQVAEILTADEMKVFAENQAAYLKFLQTGVDMQKKLFGEQE